MNGRELKRRRFITIKRGIQWLNITIKRAQLNYLFYYIDYWRWRHPHFSQPRILLMVFGGLGDSLLCETIFHHLKKEQPKRRVEILVGGGLPLFSHMPSIDTVILVTPEKVLGRGWGGKRFRQFVQFLAARGYEECVELIGMVPPKGLNSAFTGLILWATGAPVRIGRRYVGRIRWEVNRQGGRRILSSVRHSHKIITHLFDPDDPRTRTKHESLLCRRALGQNYQPLSDHPQLASVEGIAGLWAEELLKKFSEEGKYLVVGVNMEASYALKEWPKERFLTVLDRGRKEGLRFVVVGLRPSALADRMKERLKEAFFDLSGRTDLEELLALVSRCDIFFSVDSGPAHLAQAYEIPTLVLFGPSNDQEFGPVASIHHAIVARRDCGGPPCVLGPCVVGRSCMLNVTEEEAAEALLLMARRKRAGSYPTANLPASAPKEIIVFQ